MEHLALGEEQHRVGRKTMYLHAVRAWAGWYPCRLLIVVVRILPRQSYFLDLMDEATTS